MMDRSRGAAAVVGTPATRELIPADPRFSTRWHRHDYPSPIARWNFHPEYELHLITQGTGRYIVGDTVGRFAPGQLVLVGPELPHDWVSDLEPGEQLVGRDVVLQFHDDWLRECLRLLPELAELRPMLDNSTRGIEFTGATAERGARLLESIGEQRGARRLTTTFELFGALAESPESDRRYLATAWVPTLDDPRAADVVSRTVAYIVADLTRDLRLSTAAQRSGMSDSAFSRYFARASGQSFSDMVRKLRLAHACSLLDGSSDPVSSIAQAVGYRNLSNFNRQFLRELGCTPLQYRRRPSGT